MESQLNLSEALLRRYQLRIGDHRPGESVSQILSSRTPTSPVIKSFGIHGISELRSRVLGMVRVAGASKPWVPMTYIPIAPYDVKLCAAIEGAANKFWMSILNQRGRMKV